MIAFDISAETRSSFWRSVFVSSSSFSWVQRVSMDGTMDDVLFRRREGMTWAMLALVPRPWRAYVSVVWSVVMGKKLWSS